jgi:hypothetical protein
MFPATRTSLVILCLSVLGRSVLGPTAVSARELDAVALARAGRLTELQAIGRPAVAPLVAAYRDGDRPARTAILVALGSLNVKSAEATAALSADVDGADTFFQQLHRYALQAVDPEVYGADLYTQVSEEGVPLDPELGRFMYSTLSATYSPCDERLEHARRWVADLASADPRARYAAIVSLRLLIGATHGYHPWAGDAARGPAVAAWREWLRALERTCRG